MIVFGCQKLSWKFVFPITMFFIVLLSMISMFVPSKLDDPRPRTGATSLRNDVVNRNETKHVPTIITREMNVTTTDPVKDQQSSPMQVALCHPTLHKEPDLSKVLNFVSYYRHLGFDHIFLWYQPHIANLTYFDVLNSTPYVTLTPFASQGYLYYGQRRTVVYCLRDLAKHYDWALTADADEYLWFHQNVTVKQFLGQYHNYTYLSFGKWMYTLQHMVNDTDIGGLGLNMFPFTAKSFCYGKKKIRGNPICPTYLGRSKVMVRPSHYGYVGVHGDPANKNGSMHFHTSEAHLKEWVNILLNHHNVTLHDKKESFNVTINDTVNIHSLFQAHPKNDDGTVTMYYDENLRDWLEFLSNTNIQP